MVDEEENEAILALRQFVGDIQVTQAQLRENATNIPPMYVGATGREDPKERFKEHNSKFNVDFVAVWAPSDDMKRDEQSLLDMSVGNVGNQNIAKTSGIGQGRNGTTYALYPVAG